MKMLSMLPIGFFLMACLLAGCGDSDDDDDDDSIVGPGGEQFALPAAGAWAEHVDHTDAQMRYRLESLGEDTLEGRECLLFEYETTVEGQKLVTQVWLEKATLETAFLFMKMGGEVSRMDFTDSDIGVDMIMLEEPDETKFIGEGKYTTPSGKTVDILEYGAGVFGYAISHQVPFGQVLTKENGAVTTALDDFGSTGASRDITKQEAENAETF